MSQSVDNLADRWPLGLPRRRGRKRLPTPVRLLIHLVVVVSLLFAPFVLDYVSRTLNLERPTVYAPGLEPRRAFPRMDSSVISKVWEVIAPLAVNRNGHAAGRARWSPPSNSPPQLGRKPRPRHEKGTRRSNPQPVPRNRANPPEPAAPKKAPELLLEEAGQSFSVA